MVSSVRQQVITMRAAGHSVRQITEALGVSRSTIRRYCQAAGLTRERLTFSTGRDASMAEQARDRFETIGYVVAPSGCFIWAGEVSDNGYGVIHTFSNARQTTLRAHRVAYEVAHGASLPNNLTIDHRCFEKRCVNWRHLEAVTHSENSRRSYRDGRHDRRIAAMKGGVSPNRGKKRRPREVAP